MTTMFRLEKHRRLSKLKRNETRQPMRVVQNVDQVLSQHLEAVFSTGSFKRSSDHTKKTYTREAVGTIYDNWLDLRERRSALIDERHQREEFQKEINQKSVGRKAGFYTHNRRLGRLFNSFLLDSSLVCFYWPRRCFICFVDLRFYWFTLPEFSR